MDGPRFIKKIHAQGILSFGPTAKEIELQPLNVVIGPNGVGKSNLIDLVSIVRALPTDVAQPFRMGGGIRNWIWSDPHQETAQLSSEIVSKSDVLRGFEHCLRFDSIEDRLNLIEEIIQTEETKLESWDQPWLRISIKDRVAKLEVRDQSGTVGMDYTKSELDPNATILAQQNAIIRLAFKNSNEPLFAVVGSVLGDLADGFKSIRIFRDWGFGTLAAARRPQGADLPADFLSEDSENLALVLNDLWLDASVQERILDLIREFNRQIVDLEFRVVGGTIQLVVIEGEARRPIPASRVSDGTIKFLALLAILCHPKPPRLICIEEPELGLHPDAIQIVAEMLKEASRRTQLIVTTHSSSLVSALSDVPEAVMVCERDFDGSTTLRRLEADRLKKWLNDYSLGDLWLMGELGGTH